MRSLLACLAIAMLAGTIGCNEAEKPAPETKPKPEAGSNDSADSSTPAAGELTEVSLKVPGMTWGGCVAAVSGALKGMGATDINCDAASRSCSFKAPKDLDVEGKLKELEKTVSHLKGWEKK